MTDAKKKVDQAQDEAKRAEHNAKNAMHDVSKSAHDIVDSAKTVIDDTVKKAKAAVDTDGDGKITTDEAVDAAKKGLGKLGDKIGDVVHDAATKVADATDKSK